MQELIYELKVKDVMTNEVISVGPDTKLSDLRVIMRENGISGAPVTSNGELVGIISVEDLINWLCEGGIESETQERMSRHTKYLFEDEPLVHAVSALERFGFGRLPVLNRQNKLTGVLTKGDIIEGVMRGLQIDYHEEEIHHYRASHFFEDIQADEITLVFRYQIRNKSVEQGGSVASALKKNLRRLDIHPAVVRRAAISTYEAEMNIIIYAGDGQITVSIDPKVISIQVQDEGPGIIDVENAVKPGYSTAPSWVRELGFGAGMGLSNIKNCAESFEIASYPGQGTRLSIRIPLERICN